MYKISVMDKKDGSEYISGGNYCLYFLESTWIKFIDLGIIISLTKDDVIKARSHPQGFIGKSNGINCYLSKLFI